MAIVLSSILLAAATGGSASLVGGVVDFLAVFGGGALIGAIIGFVAGLALPWLDRLPGAALSLAVAYGTFVLAEAVLGFSGVMATAAAGMALAGIAPSRGSLEVRELWHQLWDALDYVANALLFLLVGLVIGVALLVEHLAAVLLAVAVVLVARLLAVVPTVWLLEKVAHIPRVGVRNEAVLVWGGLRGGVALALALALPDDLADRDLLVALTGGVVLATLLLNATTVGWLVHRLGLDRPSDADRFLTAIARLAGVRAARAAANELGPPVDHEVWDELSAAERRAHEEIERLDVGAEQGYRIVVGCGLHAERTTYQALSDDGLLPPAVTRTLLHEVDDEIDDLSMLGTRHRLGAGRRDRRLTDRMGLRLLRLLPEPAGSDPTELAYAEATARRVAAHRTAEAFRLFDDLPAIRAETVERARRTFDSWEAAAVAELDELDTRSGAAAGGLRRRQADTLARIASHRELAELVESGALPAQVLGGGGTAQVDRTRRRPGVTW